MLIRWTLFDHYRSNVPQPYGTEWDKFSALFSRHKVIDRKESVKLFSMNIYKEGGTRGNDGLHSMSGVVLDFDGKHEHAKALKDVLPLFKDYSYIAYTTFSYREETPCFRVVLPFKEPITPTDYKEKFAPAVRGYLKGRLASDLKELDKALETPAQIYFVPSHQEGNPAVSLKNDGAFLSPEAFILRENARNALNLISPDCDYHMWIKVGMALYSALDSFEGFDLWNEWSSSGSSYPKAKPEETLANHWRSFKKDGIGIGTLFHLADYHPGERLASSLVLQNKGNDSLADQILAFLKDVGEPCMPREIAFGIGKKTATEQGSVRKSLSRLFDKGAVKKKTDGSFLSLDAKIMVPQMGTEAASVGEKHASVSEKGASVAQKAASAEANLWANFDKFGEMNILDLSHTPILESIYTFFTSNCKPFLPYLSLGATISVAGHLLRRNAQCRGKRSNFYTLLVGRTGGGKDSVAKNIRHLLTYKGEDLYMSSKFVSAQGFERVLASNRNKYGEGTVYAVTDEAAGWFNAFNGKSVSQHYEKLKTTLKECYSGEDYETQNSKSDESIVISRPFVSCTFLGTPSIFENIKESDITDGLIGRMLVFQDFNNEWSIDPDLLVAEHNFIPPSKECTIRVPGKPYELYTRNEDIVMFLKQFIEVTPRPSCLPENYTQFLLARLHENFNKLLLLTLNEKGETSLAAARWAASTVIYCYRTACSLIAKDFNKTSSSEAVRKMLELVRIKGSVSKNALRRKPDMLRLNNRDFSDALRTLEETELVDLVTQTHISGGRETITINITEKGKNHAEEH